MLTLVEAAAALAVAQSRTRSSAAHRPHPHGGHNGLGARRADGQRSAYSARIDSELRRARAAGGRASGPAVELREEIEALAATLRKIHRERELDIECRIGRALRFHGDREDLLEICGNLLDNACKWARARVVVSARDGNGLVLAVEDDGPGCSPEDMARLAQRGMRLDEGTEGHGLGLSIARGIAAPYGASLRFDRSEELGGFRATLAFPRVTST
jgi:signal transduction histidine kinase